MTQQQLCSLIAKQEGKKSQVSIGNIREVVRILRTLIASKKGLDVLRVLLK